MRFNSSTRRIRTVGFLIAGWCLAPVSLVFAQLPQSAPEDSTQSTTKKAPANWFNLDRSENQVPGVSSEKAYQLLQGRPSKTVVVAVIDGGVDEEHEDLKSRMWVNEDEVAGNGVDDDKNGYVDDVHGWNFIGGKDGRNVNQDTYEVTREYGRLRKKYEGITPKKGKKDPVEYAYFQKLKATVETKVRELQEEQDQFKNVQNAYRVASEIVKAALGKDTLTADSLKMFSPTDEKAKRAQTMLVYLMENGVDEASLKEMGENFERGLKYGYNLDFDSRATVGDNYANLKEKYYGNNDVTGPDASHGTHVAGIIAADRTNALGMRGVADNVRIMAVRAVPNGDERDKDVANAIYYAVDNGARIINMSFGKDYSPNKELVDAAVNYATSKGVLLVHAAGNDGENIDTASNFPTVKFSSTSRALKNWIEVGASSWKDGTDLVANFSNYGKNTVDLFAPGVDVYSTTPNQGYQANSGTSMAAPVTSGVAALLMSYFPNLSTEQIREILVQSTVKFREVRVNKPGEEEAGQESTVFGELSKTGGVVNAYEAVKKAESLSGRQLTPAR